MLAGSRTNHLNCAPRESRLGGRGDRAKRNENGFERAKISKMMLPTKHGHSPSVQKARTKSFTTFNAGGKGAVGKGFSESVTPEVLENSTAEEIQRQELIYEFINSERQYMQDLGRINEHIVKPITAAKLLSKTELTALFANFAALMTQHQGLLDDLEKLLKEGAVVKKFGEILSKQADIFASYLVYASNYPLLKSLVEQLKERNPEIGGLFQKIGSKPELQGVPLLICLSLPIHRLPRYPDAVQNILNLTPPDHIEHKDLMDAYTRMKDSVDMASQGNNSQQMSEIQKRLDPTGELDLASPNRKFVREGPVSVVLNRNFKKKIEAELIACNDMILFTKKKKGVPKIFKAVNIASCQIHNALEENGTEAEDAFELISDEGESVTVYLNTKEEKEGWLIDLEPYVDLAKGLGEQPKILYTAAGTKAKKMGIKSLSRALVPRVFKKQGPTPDSPILNPTLFTPPVQDSFEGEAGSHPDNDGPEGSDAPKSKGKQKVSQQISQSSQSQAITTGPASSTTSNSEERVVRQIVIPRNLPLGMEMEIKHLSAKLQKRLMKCNELKKQVSVIQERKKALEKELEQLQKSEKHAQIRSIADDLLTGQALLCFELQQLRWFSTQLNRAVREKSIVEKDLEKIKQKLERKQSDDSKPKRLNEEDVTKLLVNMVAFETEKAKLCEIEKNRLAEACAGSLRAVQAEHDRCIKDKEATLQQLSKLRLELRVQQDRSKALQQDNQLLKQRFAEAEQALAQLPYEQLQAAREALLRALEEAQHRSSLTAAASE